jgi:nitrite reductase/ring-hydroxylating ferredoxin subunit
MSGRLLAAMSDSILLPRLEALAARNGLQLERGRAAPPDPAEEEPAAAIVELELPGAVDLIGAWRRAWPEALLAASIRVPDQELWHGALAAGADLVSNRGAFVVQLERALAARRPGAAGPSTAARLPVRIIERSGNGLVGRVPDAPGGSIAVFRIDGTFHAVRDECPHAGTSLADGVLQGTILTCPGHGSQFDVTTGARERGPSDFPIRTYRVVVSDAGVAVEVPE